MDRLAGRVALTLALGLCFGIVLASLWEVLAHALPLRGGDSDVPVSAFTQRAKGDSVLCEPTVQEQATIREG